MIGFEIDDSQVIEFTKKSPKRAEWAMSEALRMAGGHFGTKKGGKNSLREFVRSGEAGVKPLSPVTIKLKGSTSVPLYNLGALVQFKYSKRKGVQQVRIGWIKPGQPKIVRRALYGGRRRISEKQKKFLHTKGIHLKKSTKFWTVPARPILDIFWSKKRKLIWPYVEKRFFKKFFSKERARIGF